jgi:hypothetical protein
VRRAPQQIWTLAILALVLIFLMTRFAKAPVIAARLCIQCLPKRKRRPVLPTDVKSLKDMTKQLLVPANMATASVMVGRSAVAPAPLETKFKVLGKLSPIANDLAAIFGFQTGADVAAPAGMAVQGESVLEEGDPVGSNVENQIEAMACLLTQFVSRMEGRDCKVKSDELFAQAVDKLFIQTMANFERWLAHLKLKNHWMHGGSKESGNTKRKLTFLMLNYLIWGEASNLRELPEYMCFLLFVCGNALAPIEGESGKIKKAAVRRLHDRRSPSPVLPSAPHLPLSLASVR